MEIQLTQGKVTLVSDEDYKRVSQFKWFTRKIGNGFYAARSIPHKNGKQTSFYMHRFILGVTDTKIYVDHINGNGLDNRRSNLRECTPSQNQANSKPYKGRKFKGVYPTLKGDKYFAQMRKDSVQYYLGRFDNQEDAARAYDKKAIELHGEFARLNFKQ